MEKVTLTIIFKGDEGINGMKTISKQIAEDVGGSVVTVIQVGSVHPGDTDIPARGKGFQAVFSVPALTTLAARNLVQQAGVVNLPVAYLSIR